MTAPNPSVGCIIVQGENIVGIGITSALPGSASGLYLVVSDIEAACAEAGIGFTHTGGVCTACSPIHWSHRARGDHERQALVAWLDS